MTAPALRRWSRDRKYLAITASIIRTGHGLADAQEITKAQRARAEGLAARQAAAKRWRLAREAALERDARTCRKCLRTTGLEVHHIHERNQGGGDEIANLITLCADCHAEWTWCQPPNMAFEAWRAQPPARLLVPIFAEAWPDDVSAAAFKEQLLNAIALELIARWGRR